jgi:hypothetical protein
MKCHWCGKEFEKDIYYDWVFKKVIRNHYKCPNDHGEFHLMENGTLEGYSFSFWSDEEVGHRRYKISKIEGGPISLYIRNLEKTGGYKKVLDIPNPPPMELKNDVPQVQRMYERLKKLAIFA